MFLGWRDRGSTGRGPALMLREPPCRNCASSPTYAGPPLSMSRDRGAVLCRCCLACGKTWARPRVCAGAFMREPEDVDPLPLYGHLGFGLVRVQGPTREPKGRCLKSGLEPKGRRLKSLPICPYILLVHDHVRPIITPCVGMLVSCAAGKRTG
jgi:hypothetical protein